MLEPGKSYLLTYHVCPVMFESTTVFPTANGGMNYTDANGVLKSFPEAPRLPLIRDRYIRKRTFFTMPAGDAPIACKVLFSVFGHSTPGVHIRVDDVSLVQVDENDFPKYGYYAWIRHMDEKLYAEPGGGAVCFVAHTNYYVTLYDQTMVDGTLWYQVREFGGNFGWIEADRLGWTPPQLYTTQKYVTLSKDRVWPRNMQLNRCAYYWPEDRRVLVRDHDAG